MMRRVAGHEAAAQPGHVAALGQQVRATRLRKSLAAQLGRRFQRRPAAARRGSRSRCSTRRRRSRSRAGRTARTASSTRPAASPRRSGCRASRRTPAACGPRPRPARCPSRPRSCAPARWARSTARRRPAAPRLRRSDRRDWARHHRRPASGRCIDHRLREREQRLARAVDRQHLRGRVERQAVAALQPAGEGLAQLQLAGGGRIDRQRAEAVARQRLLDEGRRRVLGLADAQADRRGRPDWA